MFSEDLLIGKDPFQDGAIPGKKFPLRAHSQRVPVSIPHYSLDKY